MAQHYRLPFFGTAGCSDAKFPDAQAAAEATFSCFSSALSGANLVHDSGWLDHGSVASPAYMVLVHEVLHMVNQYMGGVPVSDETLALDLIDRVGPGGHYLQEAHTLQHFRNVWYSNLFDRTIYAQWLSQGAKDFQERLREQTEKALEHKPEPLPDEVAREVERMAQHWR
jgi:trimethylamine--corrinoid protein Co-methyltransferase